MHGNVLFENHVPHCRLPPGQWQAAHHMHAGTLLAEIFVAESAVSPIGCILGAREHPCFPFVCPHSFHVVAHVFARSAAATIITTATTRTIHTVQQCHLRGHVQITLLLLIVVVVVTIFIVYHLGEGVAQVLPHCGRLMRVPSNGCRHVLLRRLTPPRHLHQVIGRLVCDQQQPVCTKTGIKR